MPILHISNYLEETQYFNEFVTMVNMLNAQYFFFSRKCIINKNRLLPFTESFSVKRCTSQMSPMLSESLGF